MSEAMIIDVTVHNIQEMVIRNSSRLPVMVSFWSPLNEESKQANQILEKLAGEFAGKFILAKVNADQQAEIAQQFGLPGVPFFKLIRNADIVTEKQGLFAEQDYRELIESQIEDEPSEVLRKQATVAFAEGQVDQAIQLLSDAAKEDPNNYRVHLDLVMMYLQTGHLEKAEDLFEKLPDEAQQDPIGKELGGILFFSKTLDKIEDIPSMEATLAENPDDQDALYALAGYLMLNGQIENAFTALLKLFSINRDYGEGLPQKALIKAFDMSSHKAPEVVAVYRRQFQNMLF